MAGQAVIGYVSLVYMNLFLTQTLKVDPATSNLLVAAALLAARRSISSSASSRIASAASRRS